MQDLDGAHVQGGQVGFPLMLNKAVKWGQEVWIWVFTSWTLPRKAFLEWASGLSLAPERCINVGSRSVDMGFLKVGLLPRRACSKWASGLSLNAE